MSKPVDGFYARLRAFLRPILNTWVKWDVRGQENLPREGGYIVAPNHVSNIDPLLLSFTMAQNEVPIRFMAKKSLFHAPVIGYVMRNLYMVPVDRSAAHPGQVLEVACRKLREGEAIGIYAEGTLTADPGYWPMRMKTGVARMALDTGVPVIPVAQWGAQKMLPRYSMAFDLRPRRPVHIRFLPAVDLSDLISEAGSQDHAAVEEATRRIHAAVRAGVEELRGEAAPETVWDPDTMGYPGKGDRSQNRKDRRSEP